MGPFSFPDNTTFALANFTFSDSITIAVHANGLISRLSKTKKSDMKATYVKRLQDKMKKSFYILYVMVSMVTFVCFSSKE